MPLSPGTRLGPYEIVGLLGTGGMGEVYKATDTTLGRAVAIKVLPERFSGEPDRMARFEREARLLASLNHPHIASIYGVGSGDGVRFLAMELVEGDDLAVRIAHGPIPVAEAIEIARQVAEALEAAHEKGIIHRDLKPANVKLAADGQVKVLDFGLAKALDDETGTPSASVLSHSPTMTSPMTAAHVILGTAAYMSPEQARGKPVDRRADIWAFGCLLYECLTGRRAFAGETLSDTIAKILERDPELEALPRATPPRVRELLKRCLAKDPKLRLRDIGDARITLDEILAARSPSGGLLSTDAPRGAVDRRTLTLGALGGIVVGLLAGAAVWRMLHVPSGVGAEETACLSVAMPEDLTVDTATITLDGRTLILSARPKGSSGGKPIQSMVYTRPLERYDWRPIAGTEGGLYGRGTVDGRGILFARPIAEGMRQRRLFRIPLDGSAPPTAIADVKESWRDSMQMWNGDILGLDADASLVRIPAGGGPPSPLVKLDAGVLAVKRFELGSLLPGDRSVLVTVVWYDIHGYHYSVGVAELSTGKVKVIVEDGGSPTYVTPGFVVFTRGSVLLAVPFDPKSAQTRGAPIAMWNGIWGPDSFSPGKFRVTSNGSLFYRPGQAGRARTLAFLDAAGNLKPWSAERYEFVGPPVVSPDGRRFASVITNGRAIDEIWISELDHPSLHRLGTDPSADCGWPVWSPDGSSIAYQRTARDGRDGVYVQSASGGEARLVWKPESDDVTYLPWSFLPDGSTLLASRVLPGGSGIVSITLAGSVSDPGRTHRIAPSDFNANLPKISPDGHWLAYVSDETGKFELYVAAFHPDGTTGPPVRASIGGSGLYEWSRDGKALFFFNDQDHMKLWKVSVATRPTLAISPPVAVIDLDERGLGTGTVLPDGRFLVAVKGEGEDVLTRYNLVLNWTRELERKLQVAR